MLTPLSHQTSLRPKYIDAKTMRDFELIRRSLDERLAPPHSLRIEADRIKQAAVTLLLREEQGTAELLIIKRSERDGDPWSGHLALPGGRAEPQDADLLITAARETFEEVGIDLLAPDGSRDRFIGQLPLILPTNPGLPRIEITPLVALAPQNLTMTLSGEVGATFWIPVHQLNGTGLSATHSFRHGDLLIKRSAYPTEGGPVWGITERILTTFLALLNE